MAVHLRVSARGVLCKARGGYRSGNLGGVNCPECLAIFEEILYMENVRWQWRQEHEPPIQIEVKTEDLRTGPTAEERMRHVQQYRERRRNRSW